MTYSFRSHMDCLAVLPSVSQGQFFALVDAGQIENLPARLMKLAGFVAKASLFEGTFAAPAIDYSPLLLQLPDERNDRLMSIGILSDLCCALPILGFLSCSCGLDALMAHLRGLMPLHVEGTPYLWRFADTQMLQATAAVLDSAQYQRVFGIVHGWYTVDHRQALKNHVGEPIGEKVHASMGNTVTPLNISAAQEFALLDQVAGFNLASQLRAQDKSFARALTHAQQVTFAENCLMDARELALNLDADLFDWALERWRTTSKTNVVTLPESSS